VLSRHDLVPFLHDLVLSRHDLVPFLHDLVLFGHDLVLLRHDLVPFGHDLVLLRHDLVLLRHDLVPCRQDLRTREQDPRRGSPRKIQKCGEWKSDSYDLEGRKGRTPRPTPGAAAVPSP
jgi:hypothetical protein